jgi:DNA processing protein
MVKTSGYSLEAQLIALCKFGRITPRMFEALFPRFGGVDKMLEASKSEYSAMKDVSPQLASSLGAASDHLDRAALLVESISERDIHVKTRFGEDYPRQLLELNDPPPLLFVRGSLPDAGRPSVTIVGASKASNNGIQMTTRLARMFIEAQVQVVSSLRGGIDAAVHLGSKAVGGTSFALVDSGFDHLAGEEIMPLAIDIAHTGGVISEYLPDQPQTEQTMKETNRLLVGLTHAIVISEMYADSGGVLDLLSFCSQIGKLTFIVVDPEIGALSDKDSLRHALENGAIPIEGYDKVDNIINALV